jgi:hypothetical protein
VEKELADKLTGYLEVVESGVNKGTAFVSEQVPLYVQEFLAWELWSSIILSVLFLIGSGLAFRGMKACAAEADKEGKASRDNGAEIFGTIVCFIGMCVLFGFSGWQACHAVKVGVAPRVVIVDYLRKEITACRR